MVEPIIENFLGLFLSEPLIPYAAYGILFAGAYSVFRFVWDAIRGFLGK